MAEAVAWQILDEVRRDLQEIRFPRVGGDSTTAIPRDNIVIKRPFTGSVQQVTQTREQVSKPGILIVPGTQAWNPRAGENKRDDGDYEVLLQIVDDATYGEEDNLRTHLKWMELIRLFFINQNNFQDATTAVISWIDEVFTPDRRKWRVHADFVGGVILHVLSRETRGI